MKRTFLILIAAFFTLSAPSHAQEGTQPLSACGKMNAEACDLFKSINKLRRLHRRAQFKISDECVAASQAHAKDMARNDYFSHDGLDETWVERMDRFDVEGRIAENIAYSRSAEDVLLRWLRSRPHKRNLLSRIYKSAGVGYAKNLWVLCSTSEID